MTQTTQTPSPRGENAASAPRHSRTAPRARERRLDHYTLVEELGSGGMATVHRALDTRLQREVALKVLHEHIASRPDNRERFEQEARAVARLEHPNIIRIYGVSPPDAETQYIAAELVDGPTLRTWIDERGVRVPALGAMVCLRVARALQHAHDAGVIHRDVKPENVMITSRGVPKLMDFGLARVLDAERLTQTGAILGSPAHMSPELIEGRTIDQRADVFAFGTILFYATTGRLPFDGRNPAVILNAILGGHFADPERVDRRVSPELAAVIRACLQREPDARPQSMREVAEALDAALAACGIDDVERSLRDAMDDPGAWERAHTEATVARLFAQAEQALVDGKPTAVIRLSDRLEAWTPGDPRVAALVERAQAAQRKRRGVGFAGAAALVIALGFLLRGLLAPAPPPLAPLDATAAQASVERLTTDAAAPAPESGESLGEPPPLVDLPADQLAAERMGVATLRARVAAELERERAERSAAQVSAIERASRTVRRSAGRGEGASILAARRRARRDEAPPRRTTTEPEVDPSTELARTVESGPPPPAPVEVTVRVFPTTARIRIDGRDYGQAADLTAPLALAPGTHQIVASIEGLPQARVERSFNVLEGRPQTLRLQVPWPPARVRVQSRQPGAVFIDGRHVGPTNRFIDVPIPGYDRTVQLTIVAVPDDRDAAPWRRSIEVSAANETSYEASF